MCIRDRRYRRSGSCRHPRPHPNCIYNWPDKTLYDIPVSYTHLDVYKRQDMPLVNVGSQNIFMLPFGYCVGKLPPDFMGFSVIDFSRLKGLYQVVG